MFAGAAGAAPNVAPVDEAGAPKAKAEETDGFGAAFWAAKLPNPANVAPGLEASYAGEASGTENGVDAPDLLRKEKPPDAGAAAAAAAGGAVLEKPKPPVEGAGVGAAPGAATPNGLG